MPVLLVIGHDFSFPTHAESACLTVSGSSCQAPLHDLSNLVWCRFRQGIGILDSFSHFKPAFLGSLYWKVVAPKQRHFRLNGIIRQQTGARKATVLLVKSTVPMSER